MLAIQLTLELVLLYTPTIYDKNKEQNKTVQSILDEETFSIEYQNAISFKELYKGLKKSRKKRYVER